MAYVDAFLRVCALAVLGLGLVVLFRTAFGELIFAGLSASGL